MAVQAAVLATTLMATNATGLQLYTSSATIGTNATFAPNGKNNAEVYEWVDRSGATTGGVIVPILQPLLHFHAIDPRQGNQPNRPASRAEKTKLRLVIPVPNITSPSTGSGIQPQASKAGDMTFNIDASIFEGATDAQRQFALSYLASVIADTINANDSAPTDPTGSPFRTRILTGARVW